MRNSSVYIKLILLLLFSVQLNGIDLPGDLKVAPLLNLPQNDVDCIFEDSKGFIWIGTLDGLHRYDGYSYKTYRISADPGSISSNMIIDIAEDSKGNIWVATYGRGISKLDPVTEKFTNYSTTSKECYNICTDDAACIIVDDHDVVWIGNLNSVTRITLDETSDKVTDVINFSVTEIADERFTTGLSQVIQDKQGNIWLGSSFQLFLLKEPYLPKEDITFETFNVDAGILHTYEDGLLIGGSGLSTIQRNSDGHYQLRSIYNIPVRALLYKNQKIWIGNRSGVSCLEYLPNENWQIACQINKEVYSEEIMSNFVRTIIEDRRGNIWVGTRGGGIFTIQLDPRKFGYYNHSEKAGSVSGQFITSVFEDHKRNLWLGTENDGVNYLSASRSQDYTDGFEQIHVNSSLSEDRAYCIEEILTPNSDLRESVIWVGTAYPDVLTSIDPLRKQVVETADFYNMGMIFALENQGDSVLWAGSYGRGLWRCSLDENGSITSTRQIKPDNEDGKAVSSYIIRSIFLDSNENLWIGTDKGLNLIRHTHIRERDPEIEIYVKGIGEDKLSHDYILQIYETKDGKLWLGSMGAGLIQSEIRKTDGSLSFKTIGAEQGLPNNSIKSILEDNHGYLWLASNHGLSRFNPTNYEVVNYDQADGLQHNEFSEASAYRRSNGHLVFGGINGFNVFNPVQIVRDTVPPKLYFTDFYILNDLVRPGQEIQGKTVLENSIEYTDEIELKYNQNSFSIGFLGLNYYAPQKNKYRYMLEGFDNQWFNANADYRIAKYTNVPSGSYTFKVLASNSDNAWSHKPISLRIIVRPHYMLSKLAILIYVILLAGISIFTWRVFSLIAQRKKQLLIAELEKKNIEEIAQVKLRFFTNISHEFRTPLTLITTPLEKLISNDRSMEPAERQENYQLIRQNSSLMMRLVNQLMDFRRLDQQKMKMDIEEIDLVPVVKDICKSFDPLAEQKNIGFDLILKNKELCLWIDRDKIEKVIYNLLSNAFKFTPRGGFIELRLDGTEENFVKISVSDTGIGIDKKDIEQIFERYYQPDKENKEFSGGTGIGLALTKGLVDLHKGEVTVTSIKGKGSTFTVILNKGQEWIEREASFSSEADAKLDPGTTPIVEDEIVEPDIHDDVLSGKDLSILLVEDNLDLRTVVADLFRKEYKVLEADDGLQGLNLSKLKQPDLIISDIMMPNMNGIEMVQRMKNDEEVSHIPILLLTAKDSEEAQIEGFEIGADGYMPKPFSPEVLKARAVSLMRNRELLRQNFQKEIEINPMIIANSPADSKFLDQILALIEENLSESDFTVEKLAEAYGVSRIYLNRKIKSLTGETANQFFRNIRLKHAAELLKQNVLTVSEITWHVGYNDLRTFRTRFKEKFGMSPSEYAKSLGNVAKESDYQEDNSE